MDTTPINPPHIARRVTCSHSGSRPQMNRAGIVKRTPEATDELADPTVCDMFVSRIL